MKRYQFSLEKILNLKNIRQMEAQRALGQEISSLRQENQELERAQAIKSAFDQRFHNVDRKGHIDPIFFRRYQSHQLNLAQDIQEHRSTVHEHEQKVDDAREKVHDARRQTQTFEKLEEASRRAYWADVKREELNWMSEIALDRFRRRRESGSVPLMLMAIGAFGFLLTLLTVGLLFATGALDAHRATLIAHILRYNEDQSDIYAHQSKVIKGGEDPYFIMADQYEQMKKDAEAYRKLMAEDIDENVVITREVQHHRRELLHRIERGLKTMHKEIQSDQKAIEMKADQIEKAKTDLEEERSAMLAESQTAEEEQKDAAREELLASFQSMDPEDVVRVLTGGRLLQDYPNVSAQSEAISKVADYMSRMSARKRAGVLQTLTPDWAVRVVEYLENQRL